MTNKLLIIDGNNIAIRAFFSPSPYNFFAMVQEVQRDIEATHLAFAFDSGQKGWRNEEWPAYKGNRKELDFECMDWLYTLQEELIGKYGLYLASEADDAIFSIAWQAKYEYNMCPYILSSDSDLLQITFAKCIWFGKTFYERQLMDTDAIYKHMGVCPEQISHMQAITGGHDNLPGCPGLGDKTATTLLNIYPTIDEIYANIDKIPDIEGLRGAARVAELLAVHENSVRQSLKLALPKYENIGFVTDDCSRLLEPREVSDMIDKLGQFARPDTDL